jgi:predicted RNase H-like HicB family nuclease
MPATYYPAIIDRSASGFGATFPDFPGCIANGATVNEAIVNAEAALAFHVQAMAKDGDAIPAPSDFAEVGQPKEENDVVGLMVRVDLPPKVQRVLVSLDENLLRAIDAVASNRSAFMAEAARAALENRVRGMAQAAAQVRPKRKAPL